MYCCYFGAGFSTALLPVRGVESTMLAGKTTTYGSPHYTPVDVPASRCVITIPDSVAQRDQCVFAERVWRAQRWVVGRTGSNGATALGRRGRRVAWQSAHCSQNLSPGHSSWGFTGCPVMFRHSAVGMSWAGTERGVDSGRKGSFRRRGCISLSGDGIPCSIGNVELGSELQGWAVQFAE